MGDQALTRGPQNTHGLGPGTWGCTLQDKGDFADVIKEGFRGKDIISDGLRVGGNETRSVLTRGREEGLSQRETGRCYQLWRWRKGPHAEESRCLLEPAKARTGLSPRGSRRNRTLSAPASWHSKTCLGLLTSRTAG